MSPDDINTYALRVMIGLIVLLGGLLVMTADHPTPDSTTPDTSSASAGLVAPGSTTSSIASTEVLAEQTRRNVETGDTTSVTPVTVVQAEPESPDDSTTTTETTPTTTRSRRLTSATNTTIPRSTTTTSTIPTGTTTTTTPAATTTTSSTTTTTLTPTTAPTVPTTTVPPTTTTTTTTSSTTTTTLPPTTTTTTTLPPTTTTTTTLPPTTTTTTTLPPTTTTTTIPSPGIYIHKFDGHDHGDVGEWEAHLQAEIRDEFGERAGFSQVDLRWDGEQTGSTTIVANNDGKFDVRIGPFSAPSLTFTITDVRLAGYTYRPELNVESASVFVEGPN